MEIKEVAAAYQEFQRNLAAACAAFFQTVVKHVPLSDQDAIAASSSQFVDCQSKLAGVILLPVAHESLRDKLPWLFQLHLQSTGATKTELNLTEYRQRQRRTVIDATKRLILRGQPFRLNEVGHEAKLDTAIHTHLFADGFNEIRETALNELIADACRKFGVPVPQD